MELNLLNTETGLQPIYDFDIEEKKKLKLGETYSGKIVLVRNVKLHKKFFALLNVAYRNTKLNLPFKALRAVYIMKAGFFETYNTGKGTIFLPKSISFANMSEEDFQTLYSRVLDVVIQDIGTTKEIIERELIGFI